MLEGTTNVVALSLEIGTRETGGCVVLVGGWVTAGVLVSAAELVNDVVSGVCDAEETSEALVVLVSETGIVGSLDGSGVLVTPVTPVPVDDEVVMPVPTDDEVVTSV